MKLHDQLRDRSNSIEILLYYNSSQDWLLLYHLSPDQSNLLSQLYNQPFCNDLVTWPGHLTQSPDTAHNLIYEAMISAQTATTLRPTTYTQYQTYDPCLWLRPTPNVTSPALHQRFTSNPTKSRSKGLGLLHLP